MKTIAITSASSNLGKQLIPLLKDKGYTVWAITRTPLQSRANVNITEWLTNPEAHAKIQQADVVIHLAGEIFGRSWEDFYEPNVRTTEVVAASVGKKRNQKVIFLSYPGADQGSTNMFLRAKGLAEHLLSQTQTETTIFRFQFAVNPDHPSGFEEYLTFNGKEPIRIVGNGEQPLSLILQRDVLKFIMAAVESDKNGIYHISSPDQFTLKSYIETLNNGDAKVQKTPGWLARILSRFMADLSPVTVDLYLRPQVKVDPTQAVQDFGIVPEPVGPLYRRTPRSTATSMETAA